MLRGQAFIDVSIEILNCLLWQDLSDPAELGIEIGVGTRLDSAMVQIP